jgi:hypothetical protein
VAEIDTPWEISMQANHLQCWKAGDAIVLRGVWRQIVWWACSATIVQDTPQQIAIYWQAGTPNMDSARRLTPRDLLANEVRLVPRQWINTDVLMLVTPGAAHAVNVMWAAGQSQVRCWYVNLQEPLRRTKIGFDSMDHLLDIVISADQSTWHWKDEDEFEEAIAVGLYSPEKAEAIRAEGARVIELLETKQSPFCDGWERWSPPATWQIPALPEGWDKISAE